ncbi:MAG: glycine-rich protein, partial [Bacilli bacterium]
NGITYANGYGGSGGGGWYGGSGAYPDGSGDDDRGGGGGSGYVYTSSTAGNYPSGCLLNTSHYLTNASTIAGNTSFTNTTGGSETGHTGNGYAIISFLP